MESLSHGSPSPELERANDLIIAACKEVQRMLEPVEGRVPKPNLKAALHFMSDVFQANVALEQARYERVIQLLSWAAPEVAR